MTGTLLRPPEFQPNGGSVGGPSDDLFPDAEGEAAVPAHTTGILPAQEIRALVRNREIQATAKIDEEQIQPASLDLRLGRVAYRIPASFLPGVGASVMGRIRDFAMHQIDLMEGAVLERGCVYIVQLMEFLSLRGGLSATANPKSSTGRLDIFTRLIADRATVFDQVPAGYKGHLYVEIAPRTFSVVVRMGTRLNQLRLQRGNPPTSDQAIRRLHKSVPLVDSEPGKEVIDRGLAVTVDLAGGAAALVGYHARRHTDLIDLAKVNHYDWRDFWEPVHTDRRRTVILNPGDFYILASKEAVTVPPDHAAEMRAYDTQVGEFRVHYAGFFDPGFGYADCAGAGSRAVLEIRSFEVPFVLSDGQLVGRLVYDRLTAVPDKLYGPDIGSSYQRQGLNLAKQFRRT
ncbi:MAG: 2'-deoxycytidine 5'-triphosphate deaminase [Rhodospirillales bacterium]|nr:2'-deoxycytidine 5'-triphosphate deaminase [Rhodospirillales bacterium]